MRSSDVNVSTAEGSKRFWFVRSRFDGSWSDSIETQQSTQSPAQLRSGTLPSPRWPWSRSSSTHRRRSTASPQLPEVEKRIHQVARVRASASGAPTVPASSSRRIRLWSSNGSGAVEPDLWFRRRWGFRRHCPCWPYPPRGGWRFMPSSADSERKQQC
jgi:hypothetical protein